jgi:hypothetical protein
MSGLGVQSKRVPKQIDEVGVTGDTLTSRGGLSLFVRYIESIGVVSLLWKVFGRIRKSSKGQDVGEIFKQLFCYFVDGTNFHLTRFDALRKDEGYAAGIQSDPAWLLSSHSVKRFFRTFSWGLSMLFRPVLLKLFVWRLRMTRPDVIVLGVDTMVMDNDEAKKRQGVQPTYKRIQGFQPLHVTWGRFVIDALFRGGKKQGNHGSTVIKLVRRIVGAIRSEYRSDVAIVIRSDAGFMDQDFFDECDRLRIGYTCSGKLYSDIKEYAAGVDKSFWGRYENGHRVWDYLEMGDRRGRWDYFRRAVFTRLDDSDRQLTMEFARMEGLIYTNLGMGREIDALLSKVNRSRWLTVSGIVGLHHGRGRDELVHRSLKEFGPEQLPFERFAYNTAFYYTMLVAHFVFECFKEDVCNEVVAVEAYPNTLRRSVIDTAAKIVRTAGKTILKVTQTVWNDLNIKRMWQKAGSVPELSSA